MRRVRRRAPPTANWCCIKAFRARLNHYKMYQRLKERGLRKVRSRFVTNPRRERVVFLAGRRRSESQRRMSIPLNDRVGSTVWISPLADWTALDLNTYRLMNDVPQNEVSDKIHMSGECLCGAFAKPGELDEIGDWFPETKARILELEAAVEAAGHTDLRCKWGWGAGRARVSAETRTGPLCSSCELRAA